MPQSLSKLSPGPLVLGAMILAAVATRLLYHFNPGLVPPNFSPVEAVALFGGAVLRRAVTSLALLVPLAAMADLGPDHRTAFTACSGWSMAASRSSIALARLRPAPVSSQCRCAWSPRMACSDATLFFVVVTNFGGVGWRSSTIRIRMYTAGPAGPRGVLRRGRSRSTRTPDRRRACSTRPCCSVHIALLRQRLPQLQSADGLILRWATASARSTPGPATTAAPASATARACRRIRARVTAYGTVDEANSAHRRGAGRNLARRRSRDDAGRDPAPVVRSRRRAVHPRHADWSSMPT
jgi:hypothetical protein